MKSNPCYQRRAKELLEAQRESLYRFTDRLFCYLMMAQYLGGIIAALALSPKTWVGQYSATHPHVWTALVLGALISMPAIFVTAVQPGKTSTRYIVAVCQMLMGGLLIHVSGGRIETHFHVFGSLAFLAFYRDWKLMIPATLVVLADHIVRGLYFPISIYGAVAGAQWRFVEHAGWIVFEDIILFASIFRGVKEMTEISERQAELEVTKDRIEAEVLDRTSELAASETRKSAVLDNAMDGIVTFDAEGKITEINPAAEEMFGVRAEQVLGESFIDRLIAEPQHAPLRQRLAKFVASKSATRTNARWELRGLRGDGSEFDIELSTCLVVLESGPLFTVFTRDLSEKLRLEAQLAQAQKMESIGQIAAGIAHEINTPNQYIGDNVRFLQDSIDQVLGAVDGYKTLIEGAPEGMTIGELKAKAKEIERDADLAFIADEMPSAVEQALEGVETVGGIVKAIKEFSHPGVKNWTDVDLNRIIEGTLTVTKNEWKYVADVECNFDHELPVFRGHPGEIGQAVLNMIINASHAIKERHTDGTRGLIAVETYAQGDYVVMRISDNGCGMSPEVQQKVFDPFFTTKGVGIGTGQGLSITHNVIHRHAGLISIKSAVGEGTSFTLQFPIESVSTDSELDEVAA